jgi:hypothetical protein
MPMTATAALEQFPIVPRIRRKDFSRPSEKRVILSNSTTFVKPRGVAEAVDA